MQKLKRFDMHIKTSEVATQQTLIGSFMTIACLILIGGLSYYEFKEYLAFDYESHMLLDRSVGNEAVVLGMPSILKMCSKHHSFSIYIFVLYTRLRHCVP